MTQGSLSLSLINFAVPLFLSGLLQLMYGMVDMIYIGQFDGPLGSGAIGASAVIITCLIGIMTGVSTGASIAISHAHGRNDTNQVRQLTVTALILSLAIGVTLVVIGFIIIEPILLTLNTPAEILADALTYARIFLIGSLPMMIYNMAAGIIRAQGNSRGPLIIVAAGGVLNVIMGYFFMGLFNWGVFGAGISTLISQFFCMVFALTLLQKMHGVIITSTCMHDFDPQAMRLILSLGLPAGFQAVALTLSNVVVQYAVNDLGSTPVAALAIYFKLENIIWLPCMTLNQALMIFVGQNIGARQPRRATYGVIGTTLIGALVIGIMGVLCIAGFPWLAALFTTDHLVYKALWQICLISLPFYWIYGIYEALNGALKGFGSTTVSLIITVLTLCGMRSAYLLLIARPAGALDITIYAFPIAWTLAALLCASVLVWLLHKACKQGDLRHESI